MPNKTLKIKRIFAYTIYQNLRNTPPKDFPSTGELKATITPILPELKKHIGEYISLMDKATDLAEKVVLKEITEGESKTRVDEYNGVWRIYNKEHGQEIVDIVLDEEGFKVLKFQFDRQNWGSKWVANLDEFAELVEAFSEAGK
ncbi:MAG: hypothetical protein U1C56_02570 [Candidatus Curtissbacteria bacterium]|nr:hypothetical protein [Candidatus Curtissbacteria bacterium]